jgi:hypothetical protein
MGIQKKERRSCYSENSKGILCLKLEKMLLMELIVHRKMFTRTELLPIDYTHYIRALLNLEGNYFEKF